MTTGDGGPRVLMVHDYPPLTGGGLALSVQELVRLLEPDVRCRTVTSRLVDHFADDRTGHQAPRRTNLRSNDLVLAHWTFSFRRLSTLAVLLAPWFGPPVVCVIHTGPDHCAYNRLGRLPAGVRDPVVRWFGRVVRRRCAAIVALSPSHAAALRRAQVPVTHVLPLPVMPVLAYEDRYRRRVAEGRAPVVIGVVGELSRLKGTDAVPRLIDALAPRYRLRIVGSGPLRAELDRFVAALDTGRRACVTLHERVPPARMAEIYGALDCVLVLSRTESQCRVVLEAMLCGVVVLARPVDGVRDLVVHGRTGFFVDPDDPQSVRTALDDMAGDPVRLRDVRVEARRVAEEHFRSSRDGWQAFVAGVTADDRPRLTGASASPGRWPPGDRG